MKHFRFYHAETGLFHGDALVVNSDDSEGRNAGGHQKMALANCPPGHKPIEGHYDPLSQRVNVTTGVVEDYQPPPPSSDHAWAADVKRWQLLPEVAQRQEARRAALAQIARLEAVQPRAVREAVLGHAGAADRLRSIDEQIAVLRGQR
jgi:hypothetical protein